MGKGNIPNRLERNLRHAHRVCRWARRSVGEAITLDRIKHVGLMVRTIEVLAIPASNSHQHPTTHLEEGPGLTPGSGAW